MDKGWFFVHYDALNEGEPVFKRSSLEAGAGAYEEAREAGLEPHECMFEACNSMYEAIR